MAAEWDEAYIARLVAETRGCLEREAISKLLEATRRAHQLGYPCRETVTVKTPYGEFIIPLCQLPEAWANLSHVLCTGDYWRLPGYKPRRGWVVLDAGAYLGFYTIAAARMVGSEGRVVAVEPNPLARVVLAANVNHNKLSNVTILPLALCPEAGAAELHVTGYWATSSLVEEYAEAMNVSDELLRIPVECVTPEELPTRAGVKKFDLAKVDVECAEARLLDHFIPEVYARLVVEVHGKCTTPEEAASKLRAMGYRVDATIEISGEQWVIYSSSTSL